MRLEAIAGQPRAVEQLSRALEGGRVAHAYAFVGPAGAGRFTTALAFASELLAADATRGHPDLHVVTPTPPESNPKGARTIRIGAIRELERRASLRPALAARRVLILDEAERMTDDAPPALLTDPARAEALAAEAARWSDDTALYRAIEACREARLALVNNVTPRLTVDTLLARVARRAA